MPTSMDSLWGWIVGDMSPFSRVLSALLPALIISAYFIVGYVAYNVRCLIWGVPREFEQDTRGRTALVGRHLRFYFFWVINPLWRLIVASGVSANTVTVIAALLGAGASVAAAWGRFALAGWLFIFSGILDAMDGRLARARNEATLAGAAIDSILDRYTDSLMLAGLGIYYRSSWVLGAVFIALVGTSIVPYVRAKSEALGFPIRGGLMQRTERILYLGAAVAVAPIFEAVFFPADRHPMHWLAVAGIVFLGIVGNTTGISRFVLLVRAMNAASPGSATSSPIAGKQERAA